MTRRRVISFVILMLLCLLVLLIAVGTGSVTIAAADIFRVMVRRLPGGSSLGAVDETVAAILLNTRIPRVLLAFLSGAGLAVSGVMMQSVLRNPLASAFTLGVSSGASLGAGVVLLLHISVVGMFTLPLFGLVFGFLTVMISLGIAVKMDRGLSNNTIILTGMALSLFANALTTIIMSLSKEQMQQLIYWQMGSFAVKNVVYIRLLVPLLLGGLLVTMRFARAMDLMALGEEEAQTSGVAVAAMKWLLLSLGAALTGVIVSIVGVIGFIDLFIPHVARKLFGTSHRLILPASALLGGGFMVLCDLLARTLMPPLEIPVGAITAAIGAPFFIYLFLQKGKT